MDGGDLVGEVSYKFSLTDLGRKRAQDAMEQCAYVGPAPVPLEDYVEQCYRQTVTGPALLPGGAARPRSATWCSRRRCSTPSARPSSAAGSVFIYGPPGNGKTAMARAIGDFMNTAGGSIYIPYAFVADGNIITVLRPVAARRSTTPPTRVRRRGRRHRPQAADHRRRGPALGPHPPAGDRDRRRTEPRRCSTCGTTPEANFYQAPIHFKANGGVFLIDDFGRQLCSPKELLNRWILPLEDRHDFLTVASGKKFQVPFEQLIIFSTNLDPKELVDDAFLRRIRHKVGINAPARDVYERIFAANCKRLGMNYDPPRRSTTCTSATTPAAARRGRSDCRDLLEIVQSICRYRRQPVHLTRDLMVEAAASFIAEFT